MSKSMNFSFQKLCLPLIILIMLLSSHVVTADSVSSEASGIAKENIIAPRAERKQNAQWQNPAVKTKPGYCCIKGKILKTTKGRCKDKRGQFSVDLTDAKKQCAMGTGFCCNNARLSAISKNSCVEDGVKFFINKRDAGIFCRKQQMYSKNGFCCVNNKVSGSSRAVCKQKKGRFSTNRQKINRICVAGKNKQETGSGIIRQKPLVTSDSHSLPIKQGQSITSRPPFEFDESRRSLGSAAKDLNRRDDLGKRLPEGSSKPANNFGSGSASEYASGVGETRSSVGKAADTFSEYLQPRLATGSGAHRQSNDPDETDPKHVESKDPVPGDWTDTLTEEELARVLRAGMKTPGPLYGPDPNYLMALERAKIKAEKEEAKKNQERTVDSGPGDDDSEGVIDPDRIKRTSAGNAGIRYAPGEEASDEGAINYGRLSEIQSQKNQIRTFDGNLPHSNNFEDLNKRAQENIKNGGGTTRSD